MCDEFYAVLCDDAVLCEDAVLCDDLDRKGIDDEKNLPWLPCGYRCTLALGGLHVTVPSTPQWPRVACTCKLYRI